MHSAFTAEQLKQAAVEIEGWCAKYISNELKALEKSGGTTAMHEMYATVAALGAGRAVAMLAMWTGESVGSVRKRFIEAMDHHTSMQLEKITKGFKG
jgi:hypothetical protein